MEARRPEKVVVLEETAVAIAVVASGATAVPEGVASEVEAAALEEVAPEEEAVSEVVVDAADDKPDRFSILC